MTFTNTYLDLLSDEAKSFLSSTFDANRATFGGWRMEEGGDPVDPPADPPTDPPADPPADPAPEDPPTDPPTDPADPPGGDEGDTELSLDDAKKALAKVRKEAASHRTRLRDIETKLAEAKTPEQVEELLETVRTETATEARGLLVENVALKHKLPDELSELLRGDTREELEAHAKKLAKFANAPGDDPDLSGGLDPSGDPDGAFDPVKRARELRKNRWSN